MSREDQYNVTVRIEGLANPNLGTFDTFSGGEVDSEETKYRPGGMAAQVSLGGSKSVGNVTVSRLYDLSRDHPIVAALIALAGRANMTVTKQPLNVDGSASGAPLVYTGKLKAVTPPDHNSESSDAAMIELEMSSASVV
mgnify:CR=1 FL=1